MHINLILSLFIILITCHNIGQCLLNGNGIVDDDYKYQVYLENKVFRDCSGVVMDEWHILTAAHCVYRNTPDQLTVLAGSTSLVRGHVNIHDVQEIHVHKDYDVSSISTMEMKNEPWPHHRANDIAILTLEVPLLLGENIGKVQLPSEDIEPCSVSECVIAGWSALHQGGLNQYVQLLWAKAIIIFPYYCERYGIPLRHNELCSTDPEGVTRVHDFDTGGGLVCDGILVGIITTSNRAIANANVYSFLPFIAEIKAKDQALYRFFPENFP